jgi:hypothetical protein
MSRGCGTYKRVSCQCSTTQTVDLHWEDSRSGTSNFGQAREWTLFALKSELVIVSWKWRKRPLTEISTSAWEKEAGYLMWKLKGAAVGIIWEISIIWLKLTRIRVDDKWTYFWAINEFLSVLSENLELSHGGLENFCRVGLVVYIIKFKWDWRV